MTAGRLEKANRMKLLPSTVLPIISAAAWIGIAEFIRNEHLFKSFWINHYHNLGLVFPSAPVNAMVWGIWSLCYAVFIFILSQKYSLLPTSLLSFFAGFVMMWLVIGNLGVLPYPMLLLAIPLAWLESVVAALIIWKFKTA